MLTILNGIVFLLGTPPFPDVKDADIKAHVTGTKTLIKPETLSDNV